MSFLLLILNLSDISGDMGFTQPSGPWLRNSSLQTGAGKHRILYSDLIYLDKSLLRAMLIL